LHIVMAFGIVIAGLTGNPSFESTLVDGCASPRRTSQRATTSRSVERRDRDHLRFRGRPRALRLVQPARAGLVGFRRRFPRRGLWRAAGRRCGGVVSFDATAGRGRGSGVASAAQPVQQRRLER